jgi:putative ABC transport system permease protein
LPFRDADRLYMLWEADASNPSRTTILSMPNYVDFQRGVTSFEQTAIWEDLFFNFSGGGEAERVRGLRVSASAFRMLGVAPQLGRTFTPDEDTPGHNVALISDALWQSRFGSRPDIAGQVTPHQRRRNQIVR